MDTFETLTAEYQAYLDKNGLPQLSADELLYEDLTSEQRKYVSEFYDRWSDVEDRERQERQRS